MDYNWFARQLTARAGARREATPRSGRRLRLLAAAFGRTALHLVPADHRSRVAIETGERYADGLASAEAMRYDYHVAGSVDYPRRPDDLVRTAAYHACRAVAHAARDHPHLAAAQAASHAASALTAEAGKDLGLLRAAGDASGTEGFFAELRQRLLGVMDDLFPPGGPPPVQLGAARAWNDGCVVRLARAIYDARRWGDLPLLADALEDAGATDAALLGHLRGGGEHARGCWAVDAVLGLRAARPRARPTGRPRRRAAEPAAD